MKLMAEEITKDLRDKHSKQDDKCHIKARQRGQMTFTLVEQDRSSAKVIAYWILENIETAPPAKLFDALESALVAREFENKKNAD
jgi:hypothetical protein